MPAGVMLIGVMLQMPIVAAAQPQPSEQHPFDYVPRVLEAPGEYLPSPQPLAYLLRAFKK